MNKWIFTFYRSEPSLFLYYETSLLEFVIDSDIVYIYLISSVCFVVY